MSRIHDALKKAAEERGAIQASSLEELLSVSEAVETSPSMKQVSVKEAQAEENNSTGPFEEMVQKCVRSSWIIDPRMSVFQGEDDRGVGAEKFRTLRSRLYQIAGVREMRRLLVTSSVPAEGKTFIASNLAQSIIRQPDRRVLLVDADLRASRLHLALGAPQNPGLADYLSSDIEEYAVIQGSPESNLFLIAGGREVDNPSELLLNRRLGKLLDWATPRFDWIILDSPPALPVHDASIIADRCDGVLFVVLAGSTDYAAAEKAASEFREKNLIGVVLNRVESDAGYGDYYYGYSSSEAKA